MKSFALKRIAGLLVLSLALSALGQTLDGAMSSAAPHMVDNPESGLMDEFAFTDEAQGRFNWIVPLADLPWIGTFRFLTAPNAQATILLSVSDTSGVALAQCSARRGGVEENGWTEFVWSLQPDSLHCNVSSFATRTRFPLTAIPRKRYVVRVSAIEGPRCIAGLMVRNQKPTGCPPRFQRVVFVSQGFNCGCPRLNNHPDEVVGILDPDHQHPVQEHHEQQQQQSVPFPRFEPATSGLFDLTTKASFVDELTSAHWPSHVSTGSLPPEVSFASLPPEVSFAVTEAAPIEESSMSWTTTESPDDHSAAVFPFFGWNSSREISPVVSLVPIRTKVTAFSLATTTTITTTTTPMTTTTTTATTSTRQSVAPSAARATQHALSTSRNTTASPALTSSTVDLVDVVSGTASTVGRTSTVTTAPVGGNVASSSNVTVSCAQSSCENNGTCVLLSSTEFKCICPLGFTGTVCESPVPCASNPCQNGGRCEPVRDTFRCECPADTAGILCENHSCHIECANGGVCILDANDHESCNCTAGYVGYNCNVLDVCHGASNACDSFGPNATCVLDEQSPRSSPFLVNATYKCLCLGTSNVEVECASLLITTPATTMPTTRTTSTSSTSASTSTSTTSTTTMTSTTTSTSPTTSWLSTSWSSTSPEPSSTTWAESSSLSPVNGVADGMGESAHSRTGNAVTIVVVVVGVLVLLVVLFLAALLSVRFVRRSRKLHGKYNPAKEESMVGAGLSLPMATINKEERLI